MSQRLDYIDAIKGCAILLVVMGHVIPWCFSAFASVRGLSPSPILVWEVIYSFHMPLFMLVSGFLFGQTRFTTLKEYFVKMWGKALALLVPYVFCGLLLSVVRSDGMYKYWYLLTLWQLLVIVGVENYFVDKIKAIRLRMLVEIGVLAFTFVVLRLIPNYYDGHILHVCSNWYKHLNGLFFYFALGSFVMRYMDIQKLMSNMAYSCCAILFVASFIIQEPISVDVLSILRRLTAIYCCFYLFNQYFTSGRVVDYFKRLGRHSLQIYLFHFFFAIQITQIGDCFILLSQGGDFERITGTFLQGVYALGVSLILSELSLFIGKLIQSSRILSVLLLGEKYTK